MQFDAMNAIPFREANAPANTLPLLLFFSEIAVKDAELGILKKTIGLLS